MGLARIDRGDAQIGVGQVGLARVGRKLAVVAGGRLDHDQRGHQRRDELELALGTRVVVGGAGRLAIRLGVEVTTIVPCL
ncbi:MAG: hypothetical protein JWN40_2215 [Phycisphaerales bacterium]|nr:hypothetical protein [Phycisphaerales bacterium]